MSTAPVATDWDAYYRAPYKTASVTRRITASRLERTIRRFAPDAPAGLEIAEIGGANSCFYERFRDNLKPAVYRVLDTNQLGLDLFAERFAGDCGSGRARGELFDVLASVPPEAPKADVVFSVGLIEHFSQADTARAVRTHFELCRPGGLVLMTFPTPTVLYRAIRGLAELTGQWIFHDERPLRAEEVLRAAAPFGEVLDTRVLWAIGLTQGHAAFRAAGGDA